MELNLVIPLMQVSLKRLFESAFDYGKAVRTKGYNSKQAWDAFKQLIPPVESKGYTIMRESYIELYDSVDLKYHSDDNDQACSIRIKGRVLHNLRKDGTIDELNHFVIQAFRIPYLEGLQLSPLKVAQIGYNLGQCYASIHEYPFNVQVWISDSNLFNYSTYFEE